MSAARGREGFVLPTVLVLTGVLTLVFLTALAALESLTRESRRALEGARFEAAALSLEARATFLAATAPAGPSAVLAPLRDGRGAAPVMLDGRAYRAGEGLTIALQDEGGLANLDALEAAAKTRLFAALGVPADLRTAMADRLGDYIDADDLKRPQGAESADYQAAAAAPPPNRPLRRLAEVRGVLGWRQAVDTAAWRRLNRLVTVDPTSSAINVNTAPAQVLGVWFGLGPAQAAAVEARRNAAPFTTLEDLGRTAGIRLSGDAERAYGLPDGRFALAVGRPAVHVFYRARIVLTPADPERPFWIEEAGVYESAANETAAAASDVFPDPTY